MISSIPRGIQDIPNTITMRMVACYSGGDADYNDNDIDEDDNVADHDDETAHCQHRWNINQE